MSIDSTQHLSKLSKEEIKEVHKKWPNPLLPVGFMMGGLIMVMYTLKMFNQDKSNANALIGAVAIWFVLTMGSGIFNLIKLSKAKKILNTYAEKHALPQKELFKEFKKNLKHIRSL